MNSIKIKVPLTHIPFLFSMMIRTKYSRIYSEKKYIYILIIGSMHLVNIPTQSRK